ncbi:hypothetical protein DPMN_084238 [Dreissena polymorpha]|uniref:Ig-like domain-containing protein n=1 Tax=Dreissena polymorpha TaxID=45954 RepID=A0A9D3YBE7_DREPO|nr:hypothetical protein DPMN_084238 [Dreissena polymorpha]
MLAANIGQGLSISCQMLGSPSAMTLTWRVQGHNTTFFKQNATVTSADHAFGTYEYIPRYILMQSRNIV